MPTEDETLQRICEDVAREMSEQGHGRHVRADAYAREVARRYAATVGAGVSEDRCREIARQIGEAADDEFADWQIDLVVPVLRAALASPAVDYSATAETHSLEAKPPLGPWQVSDLDRLWGGLHETREAAATAAFDLATRHPGNTVLVYEAVASFKSPSPDPSPSGQE